MRRFILISILFFLTIACGRTPTAKVVLSKPSATLPMPLRTPTRTTTSTPNPTGFITNTAQPIYSVITRTNINQLELLHSWALNTFLNLNQS
jgi:hypothetical protein